MRTGRSPHTFPRTAEATEPAPVESSVPQLPLLIALFCALLALVLFVFTGRTFTIDEQSVMATTDSLARFGRWDTNLIAFSHWDLPPPSGLGRFGIGGEYYSKKSPGMALAAAPLFWLGLHLPSLGNQHAALLTPALLTALAGVLVYLLAARLSFPLTVGLAAAGLTVGGTMALVYSRLLFTEPLALAGLALAMLGAQVGRESPRGFALCGCGLAMMLGANAVYLALVPLFALWALFPFEGRRVIARLAFLGLPVALAAGFLAAFNHARFGTVFASGYHFDSGEGFTTPLWLGAAGLILSPARGILWYAPLSILAVPGWFLLRRRTPSLTWLALAVFAWHIGVFGSWWSWAGGASWGPRFLLPVMPLLVLCCLPLLERALVFRERRWQIALVVVAVLSLGVQIIGAAADINQIEAELGSLSPWTSAAPSGFNHGWDALWRPDLSPIVLTARSLPGHVSQIAWFRGGAPDALALLFLAGVLATSVALLIRLSARKPAVPGTALPCRQVARAGMLTGIVALLTIGALYAILARLPHEPTGLSGPLQELPATLAGAFPSDVLLSESPDLTWALLDVDRRPRTYGLPRGAPRADAEAAALQEAALSQAGRAWLLTYDPPPEDQFSEMLEARGALIYDEKQDSYRLRVFELR